MIAILLFSVSGFSIRFENSIESFINPKNPDLIYYHEHKDEFGDDQMLALVIPMGNVFTKESLDEIKRISDEIEKIEGIRKVRSLTTIQDIVGTEETFEV